MTLKPQVVYPICVSTKLRNRSGWNGGNGCRGAAAAVVIEVDVTLLIVIARVLTKKDASVRSRRPTQILGERPIQAKSDSLRRRDV